MSDFDLIGLALDGIASLRADIARDGCMETSRGPTCGAAEPSENLWARMLEWRGAYIAALAIGTPFDPNPPFWTWDTQAPACDPPSVGHWGEPPRHTDEPRVGRWGESPPDPVYHSNVQPGDGSGMPTVGHWGEPPRHTDEPRVGRWGESPPTPVYHSNDQPGDGSGMPTVGHWGEPPRHTDEPQVGRWGEHPATLVKVSGDDPQGSSVVTETGPAAGISYEDWLNLPPDLRESVAVTLGYLTGGSTVDPAVPPPIALSPGAWDASAPNSEARFFDHLVQCPLWCAAMSADGPTIPARSTMIPAAPATAPSPASDGVLAWLADVDALDFSAWVRHNLVA